MKSLKATEVPLLSACPVVCHRKRAGALGISMENYTAKTGRGWTVLSAKAGTAKEGNIVKMAPPSNGPTAEETTMSKPSATNIKNLAWLIDLAHLWHIFADWRRIQQCF